MIIKVSQTIIYYNYNRTNDYSRQLKKKSLITVSQTVIESSVKNLFDRLFNSKRKIYELIKTFYVTSQSVVNLISVSNVILAVGDYGSNIETGEQPCGVYLSERGLRSRVPCRVRHVPPRRSS